MTDLMIYSYNISTGNLFKNLDMLTGMYYQVL